jgi:acyl carrier protein
MQSRIQEFRRFVVENYLFGKDERLGNDDSFLDSGIIDSTGILELVMFLQNTYGIEVYDEELIPENLDSINRLEAYIERKLQTPVAIEV